MKLISRLWQTLLGAITFYTIIPIPSHWKLEFRGIAQYGSWVGLLIGGILGGIDWIFNALGLLPLTRSALVILLGIVLTGGLHLDGVMDTGDGLAIHNNPQKRLEVMRDSLTGAFGVMAGVGVIILKIVALSEIPSDRIWALMAASGWGRWGQMVAIACYPYLRQEGKGAFHQENLSPWRSIALSSLFYGLFAVVFSLSHPEKLPWLFLILGLGMTISLGVGYGLYLQFKGQTGDTYGAIVEWTEALFLCGFQLFF